MNALSKHYAQLLGLDASWRVVDVDLSVGMLRQMAEVLQKKQFERLGGTVFMAIGLLSCAVTRSPNLFVKHNVKLYSPAISGTVYFVAPIPDHPRAPMSPLGKRE